MEDHLVTEFLNPEARQLVKDGFLVEVSEGSRKLRHVFLFTDLLLCAKMKKTSAGGLQCEFIILSLFCLEVGVGGCVSRAPGVWLAEWVIEATAQQCIPLLDDSDVCPHIQVLPEHEIEEMKIKISVIKSEIQKEKKALKGQSRNVERLRKKMNEQESWLLLHSPTIPFRIHNKHGKTCHLNSVELQVLTSSCFKLRTVHNIPVTSNKDDEETPGLYGFLHVIVHSAKGFKESAKGGLQWTEPLSCPSDMWETNEYGYNGIVLVEAALCNVDSYGYFVSKAKTRVFRDTTEPQWNEEFEIELEGSQCLRILCYEKCYDKTKLNKDDNEIVDIIMGKGQVQCSEE
ncbi:unnamed protein product [Coregonus sp. 'balchen']|nr:unnamed protein product [Coregonus sp. 'balchen']